MRDACVLKRMKFVLNVLVLSMQLVHIVRILYLKEIARVIMYILRSSLLLEKGEGTLHLRRQLMKVLRSERVSMKEFLDDFSNQIANIPMHSFGSRGAYLFSKGVDSPNH